MPIRSTYKLILFIPYSRDRVSKTLEKKIQQYPQKDYPWMMSYQKVCEIKKKKVSSSCLDIPVTAIH